MHMNNYYEGGKFISHKRGTENRLEHLYSWYVLQTSAGVSLRSLLEMQNYRHSL